MEYLYEVHLIPSLGKNVPFTIVQSQRLLKQNTDNAYES